MNPQSEMLLSILAACQPSDAELAKEAYIQRIMSSKEYKELANRESFVQEFWDEFSEEKLRSYSPTQLKTVELVLPLIPNLLSSINISIRNGAGYKLTPEDKPDFMDYNSLKKLQRKLDASNGKSYSNIPTDQFMHIFDDDIIRSAKELFGRLPCDCTDYEAELSKVCSGKYFCIREESIANLKKEYDAQCAAYTTQIDAVKSKKRWHRILKLAIGLAAMLIPAVVAACTGVFATSGVAGCTSLILILSIIYWILG